MASGYTRLEAPGGRSTLGLHQKPADGTAPEIRLYFEVDALPEMRTRSTFCRIAPRW